MSATTSLNSGAIAVELAVPEVVAGGLASRGSVSVGLDSADMLKIVDDMLLELCIRFSEVDSSCTIREAEKLKNVGCRYEKGKDLRGRNDLLYSQPRKQVSGIRNKTRKKLMSWPRQHERDLYCGNPVVALLRQGISVCGISIHAAIYAYKKDTKESLFEGDNTLHRGPRRGPHYPRET